MHNVHVFELLKLVGSYRDGMQLKKIDFTT